MLLGSALESTTLLCMDYTAFFRSILISKKFYRMSLYIYIADDPQSHTNFIETPPNEYLKGFRIMNQGNQGMKPRKVFFNAVKVDCS